MKTKILTIIGTTIAVLWTTTFAMYSDWIDLYFTQKSLISEMDWYTVENNNLRVEKKWLEFKLERVNKEIQWNKDKWNIANGKLELIKSFLVEAQQ